MFTPVYFLLSQFLIVVSSQEQVIIPNEDPHSLNIESLNINIHIPDITVCQQINTDDCKNLIHYMLKCQQIIFNDPGFSYQQYIGNINIHRQILDKYYSICEGTQNDYLANSSFDLKKN